MAIQSWRRSFFNPEEYGKKHTVSLASARAGNVIGGGDWAKDRIIPDCIPFLNRWCGEVWGQCFWNEYHMLWYFSGYLGYLVLAHYIRVHLTWNRSKRFIIGTILMVIGAVMVYNRSERGERSKKKKRTLRGK